MPFDVAITGGMLVLPEGEMRADIGVRGPSVAAVTASGELGPAERVIDATGRYVLPGLVDPHTHPGNFRALGPDIDTETRSAAVGGVTTMLGIVKGTRMMEVSEEAVPLDSVRSYLDTFEYGRRVADERSHVDVGYSFVMMNRQHVDEIPRYVEECGVTSFKFFLLNPPTTVWGARVGLPLFPDEGVVFEGFRRCASVGALAMVHAENGRIEQEIGEALTHGLTGPEAWEARFPGYLEASEIRKAGYFARTTGARYYAVHVSSLEGLQAVEEERRAGTEIIAETCPQYLVLDLGSVRDRGELAKFTPPVRHQRHVDALWGGVGRGEIATVGSDHVPLRLAGSTGPTLGGSAGVATSLPLLWTYGVLAGRLTPSRLVELLSTNPAKAFGLFPRKGTMMPGSDADLILVDGRSVRRVDPSRLASWSDCSAFEGLELSGWPTLTMLRGEVVAEGGDPVGPPRGRYLHRTIDSRSLPM